MVPTRPRFSEEEAESLVRRLFGITGKAQSLPSDRDQNYLITGNEGSVAVLKIARFGEDLSALEAQNLAIRSLSAEFPPGSIPDVQPSTSGDYISCVPGIEGKTHFVRLLSFIPGVPLARVRPHTPSLLFNLGAFLGRVVDVLEPIDHPGFHRNSNWDLQNGREVVHRYAPNILDKERRDLVGYYLNIFEERTVPLLPGLRKSVLHNDANDYNILINSPDERTREVAGIIDFGDMVYSYTIGELAIGAAYAMLGKTDPLAAAAQMVKGFHRVYSLEENEIEALFSLIILRLCTSVVMSAYQKSLEPENEYLSISEKPAWALLERLREIPYPLPRYIFRNACGKPPCPVSHTIVDWLKDNAEAFVSVVDLDLKTAPHTVFDLSVGSLNDSDIEMTDTVAFTDRMFARMRSDRVAVGIGRYNEARRCYTSDPFKDAVTNTWRTVHLGIDLFGPAGSPVFAPLDGFVHSFQNNADRYDYGPTIILEHRPAGCPPFYTLYGHLSAGSLEGLVPGLPVEKGRQIASLGHFPENGDWPPHLHFQLITDMMGYRGTFPGVAAASVREIWLSLCPDPNLILGIQDFEPQKIELSRTEISEARSRFIGPSLSLSYHEPIKIVRGFKQYLYDETGRAYLDAVNNVPHVGHCHPRVVEAGRRQMAVLNTNTRYLHDNLVRYARRLCAKLPDPLRVCFFVNSGSEANDLALRLAGTNTGRTDMIVVDGAYHGNLSSLIEISPYKFDGPGGKGAPAHVHKVPMPDPYRGPYKTGDLEAGPRYARHVRDAIQTIRENEHDIAAFIVEPLLGCGGQIVPPEGYLREAFRYVREAGGLCIADEVQIGFGRVGSHFWGFETQGVVPDIVTMGKPIGNGHPLGAVVTTPEIANAFDNGMEYFNTYGGNPVSCAVGIAVLDVIEDEKLQENAHNIGNVLKSGLLALMERYPLIGDVRGMGLYIGVELVLDHETLTPAPDLARYIIERMKEEGILLSTDGPLHNVLKIKPPLVFNEANAFLLVKTLDMILSEDYVSLS